MRKTILYIAASLNGKIARPDGSVDWLGKVPNPDKTDYGYKEFLDSIDTTIQGYKTYAQLMSWGIDFPYKGKTNFVFTRNQELTDNENVRFIKKDHLEFVRELKRMDGKGIFVIGGGQINTLLLNHDLIDEIQLFIMPVILPSGISLFEFVPKETLLTLAKVKQFPGGVVRIRYRLNHDTGIRAHDLVLCRTNRC